MTPLESYLDSRFPAVFGLLEDNGGVPEELLECLKWAAIIELAKQLKGSRRRDKPERLRLNFSRQSTGGLVASVYRFAGDFEASRVIRNPTPEDLFPYLAHLTKHIDQPTT